MTCLIAPHTNELKYFLHWLFITYEGNSGVIGDCGARYCRTCWGYDQENNYWLPNWGCG